ncbi:tautomerase family protein [Acetobacter senegalensis]|uniref:tautomerase family protein n=1 Tax=Acetobacter senegalensis TaxID=446692 RepID=UPI0020A07438|nr:tautomerase family protein [Acetobacter senegalensis]MCP1196062.1 tautomerase family protein [Acetobacter senegalensis]
MPMWQIYHPENAFTDEDKKEIAQKITGIYESFLPRFYVNVFFQALSKSNFYIGGEPTDDFVRIVIDHIARAIKDPVEQKQFLRGCAHILSPYVAERGYRWELNVDETPFDLWTLNGFKPPLPNTPAGIKWRLENKPSSYDES